MGCGCPDQENDALILAEVERRKKVKEVPLSFITFSGDLWQLQNLEIKQEQIKTIKQVKQNEWEVIYDKSIK